mmetsp:Transcript_19142/g.38582  ORF Transcript_19142/g.38582 Transcript_19142/m.38582 type:complete len:465 (+) Transcript_19142:79-1473(+)
MRCRPGCCFPLLSLILQLLLLLLLLLQSPAPVIGGSSSGSSSLDKNDNPYDILGVGRNAQTSEIKSAYRAKARATHPDKNPDQDPDQAAAQFRKVVDAFEILSDEDSRRTYDRTGRTDGRGGSGGFGNGGGGGGAQWTRTRTRSSSGSGGGGGTTWTFTFRNGQFYRAPRKLRDEPKVREAQSRLMHVVSLAQLETIMLDDDDLTERSLLICFVTPGKVESLVEEDMVFPFPFAGMSAQGIWWEDLLQTVQVKFNRGNELSRFFGVPSGEDITASGKPVFVFVNKGRPLSAYSNFTTDDRKEFESWAWEQMQVEVKFVNSHSHPVELYWIDGRRAKILETLEPGESRTEFTMLSHEFYARDDRVDRFDGSPGRHKLSTNSALGSWKILSDPVSDTTGNIIYIETSCFDMSGHCEWWMGMGECSSNPSFMKERCPRSCNHCPQVNESSPDNGQENEGGSRTGDEL